MNEITKMLTNYGVNPRSKGFGYAEYVLTKVKEYTKLRVKYDLLDFIKELAQKENKSISTIKAHLRYAITTHNKHGGNLTLKDLEKIVIMTKGN